MKSIYDRCHQCVCEVFTFDHFDVMTLLGDTPLFESVPGRDAPLGDSLDLVEFVMALEDEFKIMIPDEDADGLNTLNAAVTYLESRIGKANR